MTSRGTNHRIDWNVERGRIDLAAVTTALLGPAPGRTGERGRRLWWRCPFHDDRNPSFMVEPGRPWWKCWGCNEHGDAASLVMRLQGLSFPEAVSRLTGGPEQSGTMRPRPSATARPEAKAAETTQGSRGLPLAAALALVVDAQARLWSAAGVEALAYLTETRCLTLATIQAARLGWTPRADGVPWTPPGIIIPWFEFDRLSLVKLRPSDRWRESFSESKRPPKYLEGFRECPSLYPDRRGILPGRPLVIVEGELDCLLLGQELGDLAAVATLGGTGSTKPDPGILGTMLPAAPWFIATDADEAGDKAAGRWEGTRARRVRPPRPFKDWTEARQARVNLSRWWSDLLAGGPTPELFNWDELTKWRWGPATHEPDCESADRPDSDPAA